MFDVEEQLGQARLNEQALLDRNGSGSDVKTSEFAASASSSLTGSTSSAPAATTSSASAPKDPKVKESSRKHLRALQAGLRILLESPSHVETHTFQQVRITISL